MGIAQFKDKVEKIVTRKAATSSAPVVDDNEAQTKRRYNLRKRKWQDENDKVEKIVTRKAATSSAPVHDDNEAQTKRRYNLRKRKWQDENGHCPTNANKNRRMIWLHNDGSTKVSKLKTNTLRRNKRGATKRTFSSKQVDEKKIT